MKKHKGERKGRCYTIHYNELLLNKSTFLEDFIKQDLNNYFGRELVLKKRTRYMEFRKTNEGDESYYQTDIVFGFKRVNEDNYIAIGFSSRYLENNCSIYIADKGFPINGDFLFMTTQYLLFKKLISLDAKNIKMSIFRGDYDFNINNDEDISNYFDEVFSSSLVGNSENDEKYMILGDITPRYCSRRGSEFITYFQQPYNMAWKMKGFPKEWTM